MRLWSLHPKYLDSKGLVAVWREGLLAKSVLLGKTKGYINHPQLIRFKKADVPEKAIDDYLWYVYKESLKRGYKFDKSKINKKLWSVARIAVSSEQINYEYDHLMKKLNKRDSNRYSRLKSRKKIEPHPIFSVVAGEIEEWEKQ